MTNHALAVPTEQENYEDMSGKLNQEIEQPTSQLLLTHEN